MDGVGLGLAALGFWIFVAAVVVAGVWDGIRKREAEHETLRRMIESGQPVDQSLANKLLRVSKGLDRDLRASGLIVLFIAPGLALLGLFVGSPLPLLGVSLLVGFIGIGLLVAAKVVARSDREEDASASNPPTA